MTAPEERDEHLDRLPCPERDCEGAGSGPAPEELRKAAARLRETANFASPGPWILDEDRGGVHASCAACGPRPVVFDDDAHSADFAWIATMHPGIAHPLADWLERVADRLALLDLPRTYNHPALDVARIINGGTP